MSVKHVLVNSENAFGTFGPTDWLKTASLGTPGSISSVTRLIRIKKNFLILYPKKTEVLQPFDVEVKPVGDEFVTTSSISDVYELGETLSQAVFSHLYSLVDEFIWLHEHKQSLSLAMLKDLERLNTYLRLV
jgi:hypothetical protein